MNFVSENIKRSSEEIKDLCLEMRESKDHQSDQFSLLSYEDGVLAAIRWLFFQASHHPYEPPIEDGVKERLARVQREVHLEQLEQIKENGS